MPRAKSNVAVIEFIQANPGLSNSGLLALAKQRKLPFSHSQITYYKTKLNKAKQAESEQPAEEDGDPLEKLVRENARLRSLNLGLLKLLAEAM